MSKPNKFLNNLTCLLMKCGTIYKRSRYSNKWCTPHTNPKICAKNVLVNCEKRSGKFRSREGSVDGVVCIEHDTISVSLTWIIYKRNQIPSLKDTYMEQIRRCRAGPLSLVSFLHMNSHSGGGYNQTSEWHGHGHICATFH